MKFEHFEHEADIGVRGFGKTTEEAFENCALAMFEITHDTKTVKESKSVYIELDSSELDELLVAFLNELISLSEIENMTFKETKVKITKKDRYYLTGKAFGEKRNPKKHHFKTEAKAATFSNLKVYQDKGNWVAQCIIDV